MIVTKSFFEDNFFFTCEIINSNTDIITMFDRNTYEEAREELLKRLIKIYKENI